MDPLAIPARAVSFENRFARQMAAEDDVIFATGGQSVKALRGEELSNAKM
jgi:hypothetical protein